MSSIMHAFNSQDDLVEALSQSIVRQLQLAIDKKGKASLLVSGGSTPKPLFKKLRETPLAWEKVSVGLCDERWVSPLNKESNENLVKTYLLQDKASTAVFVGMFEEGLDVKTAQVHCSKKMKEMLFPFDVLILGMGSDAHTASLFPNNGQLDKAFDLENEELCITIEPTAAPHIRMSLTRKAILSAENIYLHFEGLAKLSVYEEAVAGDDMYAMPIRSVLNQEFKNVEVYYT